MTIEKMLNEPKVHDLKLDYPGRLIRNDQSWRPNYQISNEWVANQGTAPPGADLYAISIRTLFLYHNFYLCFVWSLISNHFIFFIWELRMFWIKRKYFSKKPHRVSLHAKSWDRGRVIASTMDAIVAMFL